MKHIDSEDPRLTAYALGELPEHEAAVLRSLVEDDPALRSALAETNALAGLIRSGFGEESLELGILVPRWVRPRAPREDDQDEREPQSTSPNGTINIPKRPSAFL